MAAGGNLLCCCKVALALTGEEFDRAAQRSGQWSGREKGRRAFSAALDGRGKKDGAAGMRRACGCSRRGRRRARTCPEVTWPIRDAPSDLWASRSSIRSQANGALAGRNSAEAGCRTWGCWRTALKHSQQQLEAARACAAGSGRFGDAVWAEEVVVKTSGRVIKVRRAGDWRSK